GYIRLVGALYNVGDLPEAEKQLLHCADLVHEFGSLRDEARLTFQLGLVKYHLGELEEAEASGLQAQAWLDRTGERYIQLQNLRTLALCATARADLALAEERLHEAIALASEIGGWLVVEFYRCLVTVLIGRGRLEDARECGALALSNIPGEDGYARAA